MNFKINRKHKIILISTLLWGLVSHGIILFSKFSSYDDLYSMFAVAATFSSGRWFLGILDIVVKFLTGGEYSLPLFNGIVCLLLWALSLCIVSDTLDINDDTSNILISGIVVTFPSMATTLGFVFTAPFYLIGISLTFLGAAIICRKKKNIPNLLLGALCIALGMGIYQAYLAFAFTLMIMYMLAWTMDSREMKWADYIKQGLYFVASAAITMVIYIVAMYASLAVTHKTLTDYKGINELGYCGVRGYIERFIRAYVEFFNPSLNPDFARYNMYPDRIRVLYYLVLIAIAALLTMQSIRVVKRISNKTARISRVIQIVILAAIFPPAANLIFLMTREWFIYAMITYGEVMIFVWLIFLTSREKKTINRKYIFIAELVVLLSCIMYCRYDNTIYLKEELMRSQANSYFTTLITRIESTEGYADELPVAFLNDAEKSDLNWPEIPQFDEIVYEPYTWDIYVNADAWTWYMKYFCGYDPQNVIDDEEELKRIADMPEVVAMPNYPDDGAIKVIDGVVVVKF